MERENRHWYSRPAVARAFSRDDMLEPTVVMLFVRFKEMIVGRDVLDLGVGPGRTTLYLSALTDRYVGIDYSPAMVATCAKRFPAARIELGDARDLSRFDAASFDFVLFSSAGISTLEHESRLAVLREVARVLRPGGIFAFSAHNRDWPHTRNGPPLNLSRNPLTQVANVGRWLRAMRNRARWKPFQSECTEYALINDPADGFALLHYYITEAQQRAQLERAGFTLDSVMDHQAREWPPESHAEPPPWLWYVARR